MIIIGCDYQVVTTTRASNKLRLSIPKLGR